MPLSAHVGGAAGDVRSLAAVGSRAAVVSGKGSAGSGVPSDYRIRLQVGVGRVEAVAAHDLEELRAPLVRPRPKLSTPGLRTRIGLPYA